MTQEIAVQDVDWKEIAEDAKADLEEARHAFKGALAVLATSAEEKYARVLRDARHLRLALEHVMERPRSKERIQVGRAALSMTKTAPWLDDAANRT
jgi:hypothetical protein